jgi:hypothetical protein
MLVWTKLLQIPRRAYAGQASADDQYVEHVIPLSNSKVM